MKLKILEQIILGAFFGFMAVFPPVFLNMRAYEQIKKEITNFNIIKKEMIKKQGTNIVAPRSFNINSKKISEANKELIDFPNEISGARDIDKYLIPKAKYCLIHIRQAHFSSDITDKQEEYIKKVQQDIYSILSYLVENKELKEVHSEWVAVETELTDNLIAKIGLEKEKERRDSLENELEKEVNRSSYAASNLLCLPEQNEEKKEEYRSIVKELMEDLIKVKTKEVPFMAVYRLVSEDKIKILASGTLHSQAKASVAVDLLKEGTNSNATEKVALISAFLDDKEDIFLEIASSRGQKSRIACVYGGAHAWGGQKSCGKSYPYKSRYSLTDNLYLWNLKFPDKKFSLIEITPKSY